MDQNDTKFAFCMESCFFWFIIPLIIRFNYFYTNLFNDLFSVILC